MIAIDDLPPVRGRYRQNVLLAEQTWFRVGGPAEVVFKPEDREDLATFLRHKPSDLPVTILGAASNVIVRDGGLDGVLIKLGRGFNQLAFDEHTELIEAGAACLDINVAEYACEKGMAGLEFLSGIPGAIGGALRMNAGAYGAEMCDVMVEAEALDAQGNAHRLSLEEMGFSYRHCAIPDDWIFTRCWLRAKAGSQEVIRARMQEIAQSRADSQPVRARTGGSTFRNPPGKKAWELIDSAGCRGMMLGKAQVSEKHCNFLLNLLDEQGGATAAELEELGDLVRQKVKDQTGEDLIWEIKRIGKK
ncbi:MAG: UDP-N-acetylenolpyruvoylglucosamine reductase [Rickettsiales bacterium]|nr:UDP-N-acetylenolpyruvoylglucosamine reductase [Rickettsiales bacterium]